MTTKRVVVHTMHETEQARADQELTGAEHTPAFVMGLIDESRIPSLEKEGLIVQVLDEAPVVETGGGPLEAAPGLKLLRPRRMLSDSANAPEPVAFPDYFLIRLQGPLLASRRKGLEKLGVELLDRVPRSSYTARLTSAEQLEEVQNLPFVDDVRRYVPADTGPVLGAPRRRKRALLGGAVKKGGGPRNAYDLLVHRPADVAKVKKWLSANKVSVLGSSRRKLRVELTARQSEELATLPQVARIEQYVPPMLFNDVARELIGLVATVGVPDASKAKGAKTKGSKAKGAKTKKPVDYAVDGYPLRGDGEIVGVADTGLDLDHPDFAGRVVKVRALGRPKDPSDPHGHGTHVAGTVLGDGAASQGQFRGMAPEARLFFQSLLDSEGGLGGLPLDLNDLFAEAYAAGVRVHNNSWGAAVQSMYTLNSSEVDGFVADHPDMVVVIAAGNEGSAAAPPDRPRNSQKGFVDWLSIGSPASCKNAIVVGASRSSRTEGGLSKMTYGEVWNGSFADLPIAREPISGDPECIAAFSSRGPCDDRRIKPDLVAPGTDIVSARSRLAPARNYWGLRPGYEKRYAYMGGTSMAAPVVAGACALVREYYRKERGHTPSAALVKATLLNGTRQLTGKDALADHSQLPNFHQGFGCLHMPSTLPVGGGFQLEFLDGWQKPAMALKQTGDVVRMRVAVAAGTELRICLAYTDLAARALQNNLNLLVEGPDEKTGVRRKWMGNEQLPMGLRIPDPDNNVEMVRLGTPRAGNYLIQVSATNLLRGPQHFALVVTGALTSALVAA